MKIFESLITHAFTYYQQIYFDIDLNIICFIFLQKKEDLKHIITTATLRNFRYANRKNSCDIHDAIVWPTRLNRVLILRVV